MSKTHAERPSHPVAESRAMGLATAPQSLHPTIRRHLGRSLREHFSESLSAPVGGKLEALIAELDKADG